ncbi:MAG: hypothetical protein ACRCZF_19555 [Gemmataceae bacterium]
MDRPILPNLGFLTILQDATGTLGGYLVTNSWGRPLEFRLTTAVQPSRIQEILYGRSLTEFVNADLIGKTLLEKTSTPALLILVDELSLLSLRSRTETPVIAIPTATGTPVGDVLSLDHTQGSTTVPLRWDGRFPQDAETIRDLLARVDAALDWNEPFHRVREAVAEARKAGASRAA